MASNSSQRTFPFLSLPPELRDQIYAYLLSTHHSIDIFRYQKHFTCTKSSDSNEENPEGVHIPVAILRTCQQIHAEATPVLYSSNRFVFTFPGVFTRFVRGPRGARWIKDVEITYPCDRREVLGALKILEKAIEKLESLALGVAVRNVFGAREMAEELAGLVRKIGVGNGDRSAEKTLSRVVFLTDAGYQTRALATLAERNRAVYVEELREVLRAELEEVSMIGLTPAASLATDSYRHDSVHSSQCPL